MIVDVTTCTVYTGSLAKKNEGITLIALVITIIILLILAGVTIASLTGNNGLLGRASQAKDATEVAQEKEQLQVEVLGSYDNNGDLAFNTLKDNIQNHLNVDHISSTNFPLTVTYTATGNTYEVDENGIVAP